MNEFLKIKYEKIFPNERILSIFKDSCNKQYKDFVCLDELENLRKAELEQDFQDKEFDIKYKYKNKIKSLEKENNHLRKIIDKFYETVEKFIHLVCHKYSNLFDDLNDND